MLSCFGLEILLLPTVLLIPWAFCGMALLRCNLLDIPIWPDLGTAAAVAMAAFLSIFAHEVGHAVACELVGGRAKQIVLSGWGGWTSFASLPTSHGRQSLVFLAGPVTNLFLYLGVRWVGIRLPNSIVPFTELHANALEWIGLINLLLFVFNLLPVPMLDGGRVLYAAVRIWKDERGATTTTYYVGSSFCLGGMALALTVGDFGLLVISASLLILTQGWRFHFGQTNPR